MHIQTLTHPSWNEIDQMVLNCVNYLASINNQYDTVVGLSRGGLIPAVRVSHILNVDLVPVCYSSKDGVGDNRDHDNVLPIIEGRRILVVDDIADSGLTIKEVVDFYKQTNDVVDSMVIYYKNTSCINPTTKGITIDSHCGFIYFPWETSN